MNTFAIAAATLMTVGMTVNIAAQNDIAAGLGRPTTGALSLDPRTGNTLSLGVAYAYGVAYISQRGNNAFGTPPHTLVGIDALSGAIVSRSSQAAAVNVTSSPWGFRDGASDAQVASASNHVLLFGHENGIYVVDPSSMGGPNSPPTPIALSPTIEAANGTQTLSSNPIAGSGLAAIGNYRAVAYNPDGDGGNGSIWTANFASNILEIDLQGTVLRTLRNPPAPNGWSIYGLAFDPLTGNLWCNSAPDMGDLAEIDTSNGSYTGRRIPKATQARTQGGLGIVPGGLDGRNCGFDLIAVDQGAPDTLTSYRLHLWDNWTADMEVDLRLGYDNVGLTTEDVVVPTSASTLEFDLIDNTGQPLAAAFILNFGFSALIDRPVGALVPGTDVFKSLFELRRDLNGIVFNEVGQLGNPIQVPVMVGAAGTAALQGTFTMQAITLHPQIVDPGCGVTFPLAVTPQRRWLLNPTPPCGTIVEARGANSLNNDPSSGFFKVMNNNSSARITQVVFTWAGSSNPRQATMLFDLNEGGSAGAFWNGNATAVACGGTYRNGSDALTGLDYGATQINISSGCATGAENSGVQAGSPVNAAAVDYRTLTWRFTDFDPGEAFEVDIDTDNGAGVTGGDMAGMVITVLLDDGSRCSAELILDPVDPLLSRARV